MSKSLQPVETDTIIAAFRPAPGTEILYDQDDEHGNASRRLHALQHVKHGDSHILLNPQPSLTDPSDPLRWPSWKKWVTFSNGLAYSFLGGVTGPIMAAWMIQGTAFFDTTLQRMGEANGATLALQGVGTTIWMPFAVKYGRRPVYLLSTLLMGVACIWLGVCSSKTYTSFLLGRAFLGLSEAPIESIVPSTITDLFFLHDRGAKVSMYGLSVLGGNELGPMLSAFIIQTLGMNWAFYIVAIFIFTNFVCMFFAMPETKYTGSRPSLSLETSETDSEELEPKQIEDVGGEGVTLQPRTWVQELAFWGRGDDSISLWRAFLRPFVLLAYPTVVWSCVIYGLALSWNVILGILAAQIFAPPPYLFDSSAQGLIFLSPFVGSLVGTYLCGPTADRIANFYTRRNHGIREPEMRLPTCAIAAAVTFLGAMMAGLCILYQTHWAGPIVGVGILSIGSQMGATLAMSYALDCHKELSIELMVTVASLKSMVAWIWTWVANDWLTRDGPLVVFMTVAAVNVAVYLTTFIFYFKGKEIRIWLHDKDFMNALGLA